MSAACALCSHCLLPIRTRGHGRRVQGEDHQFCCYGCCLAFQVGRGEGEESEAAWLLIRLGVGAFLAMNVMLFSLLLYSGTFDNADAEVQPVIHIVLCILATPAALILGWPLYREAWTAALDRRLTAATLLSIGVGAAYAYSAFAVMAGEPHVYFDTVTLLLLLFTLGRFLEASGRARAMRSLEPMLAAGREEVTVVEAGAQTRRQVREVTTGTLVLVLPGERIAVDGVVLDGCSSVNEAVITGESRPITKAPGSATLAGSMNHDGALLIRSTSAGTATRWAHIARSVREALNQPGRAQRLADRIAGALVPVVLLLAAATVIAWAQWVPFHRALVTGLAVLVVACPCGLGLAGALATSLGIGRLVRQGCLVRGGDIVEALAGVRVVAFDKTGTLTAGATRVIEIETDGTPVEEVLRIAAGLEQASEHPLARAIVAAAEEHGIQPTLAQMVRAVPGCGVHGAMAGAPAAAGSATWLAGLGFRLPGGLAARARRLATSTASLVHVGSGERTIAVLALRDSLRPEAGAAVRQLRELGLRTVLLSGDRVDVAERIAAELGADDCQASLSPEEKRAALLRWRERSGPVAMVGDGLNDGPVLATADVGIAVGTATDLARETAGIVLPDGGLRLLPWVVSVSREVRRTIGTNLLWAFGYNAIGLGLAATGHLRPVAAAVLMAGSSLVVVANSLRLEWFGAQFDAAERDHAAWSDGDISDRSATAPRRARRSAI